MKGEISYRDQDRFFVPGCKQRTKTCRFWHFHSGFTSQRFLCVSVFFHFRHEASMWSVNFTKTLFSEMPQPFFVTEYVWHWHVTHTSARRLSWRCRLFSLSHFYHLPLPFSYTSTFAAFPLLLPSCMSQFVFHIHAQWILFYAHTHTHTHSSLLPPSGHFPFPSSVSVAAGNESQSRTLSRYLLDVPVNTVGAVIVMYGCNPTAAAWHGCQLPWETRWFIFCSSAYGPI